MAGETTNSLVTPEKNEASIVNMGKESGGNSDYLDNGLATPAKDGRASDGLCHAVRNSTEKPRSAESGQNTVPHFLRASIGSCHDFCKYGRKHAVEEKVRTPVRNRIAKTSHIELSPLETLVSGAEKKEKVVGHTLSLETKKRLPGLKTSPNTLSCSPNSQLSLATSTIFPRKNFSCGKVHLSKYKPSSNKKKTLSPDPPEIIKREIVLPSKKIEVPLEQGSSTDGELLGSETRIDNITKKISPLHLKSVKVSLSSSSDTSDGIHGKGRRNCDVTTGRRMTASKASAQKEKAPSPTPSSSKLSLGKTTFNKERKARNSKLLSPLKGQCRMLRSNKSSNNEKVSEKTVYVIELGSENNSIKFSSNGQAIPSPSAPKSLSYTESPSLPSHGEHADGKTEYGGSDNGACAIVKNNNKLTKIGKAQSVTQNLNKNLKKSRVVVSDNNHRSPVKLKFRSGKVVDLQSETNRPWRLKFRRARVLGAQDGKGETRRVLKNAGANDLMTGTNFSSEKVVLKHQDVQEKKDALGLFNNVIEETASKLVESRKSKVKALVGAFETVISLQDSKPPSHCQLNGE